MWIVAETLRENDRITYTAGWGWKRRVVMRLASFENLLAVATLISAIVVVLWGIKIFHGA
jgi:hypothetical protein